MQKAPDPGIFINRGGIMKKMDHHFHSRLQKITLVFILFSFFFAFHAWSADRTVLGEVFGRPS